MTISVDGLPIGSGTPGPDSVGSLEIIDDSVESIDIKDGTIQPSDLAFSLGDAPRNIVVLALSGNVDTANTGLAVLDTSGGPVTATLPASPGDGENCEFLWFAGASAAIINGNGKLINGAGSFTVDEPSHSYRLTYSLNLDQWLLTT